MKIAEAFVEIGVNQARLVAGLAAAKAATSRAVASMQSVVGGLTTAFTMAGRAALYLGGAAAGIGALGVRAFAEEEAAVTALGVALRLAGDSSSEALPRMREFAAEIEGVTTVADDTVLAMAKLGATIGGLTGQNLEAATVAAIGLSKAYGVDLESAMRLVSRAARGQTQMLARMGIVIDEDATATEKFNKLIEIGTRNFGIARAEVNTTTGAWLQMKNAVGDALEEIGGAIVKSDALGDSLKFVTSNAVGAAKLIVEFGRVVFDVFAQIGKAIRSVLPDFQSVSQELAALTAAVLTFGDAFKIAALNFKIGLLEMKRQIGGPGAGFNPLATGLSTIGLAFQGLPQEEFNERLRLLVQAQGAGGPSPLDEEINNLVRQRDLLSAARDFNIGAFLQDFFHGIMRIREVAGPRFRPPNIEAGLPQLDRDFRVNVPEEEKRAGRRQAGQFEIVSPLTAAAIAAGIGFGGDEKPAAKKEQEKQIDIGRQQLGALNGILGWLAKSPNGLFFGA